MSSAACLLQYDTVLGPLQTEVSFTHEGITIAGKDFELFLAVIRPQRHGGTWTWR